MQLVLKRWTAAFLAVIMAATALMPAMQVHAEEVTTTSSTDVTISGQLIELSSTDLPTTIVVRENPTGEFTDYVVDLNEDTKLDVKMDYWIVGDYVTIWGSMDDLTEVVTATEAHNDSLDERKYFGLNGWIDTIADDGSYMLIQWANELHTVNITDNTHLVGDEGPHGDTSDFEIGDRVRIRLIKDSDIENEASIIKILRRGPRIFDLARTRGFYAELLEIDTESNTMNVLLLENPHLTDGDVNNLVGVEGDEVTVTYEDWTVFKRKYFGNTTEDELFEGDRLQVVGRVNDDGTVSARMIRDTNIWRLGVSYHVGEILEMNTEENYIVVERIWNSDIGVDNEDRHNWTVNYDDETVFRLDREEGVVEDLQVGLLIRVRGTANNQLHTVDAEGIALYDEEKPILHKPARLMKIWEEIHDYESQN